MNVGTLSNAVELVQVLTLVALLWQLCELFSLRKIYSAAGAWSWSILRHDLLTAPPIALSLADFLFGERTFRIILILQSAAVLALLTGLSGSALIWTFVFASTLLISMRFRGTFNGGSDSMTLILLSTLTVIAWFPDEPLVAEMGLLYIAIQSMLSYLVAGLVKIKNPNWRSGLALRQYLTQSGYDVPILVRALATFPKPALMASWASMLFEIGFISLLIAPTTAAQWMVAGIGFHLGNFATFGLNRFVWAWVATYPAILWSLHLK